MPYLHVWTKTGTRLVVAAFMTLACMGSFSGPLQAEQFVHVDPLFFSKLQGGANPVPQVVTVASTGGSALGFNVSATTSSGGDWLAVSQTGDCCITPAALNVIVSASDTLAAGSYSGQILFMGTGTSLTVDVTLVVAPSNRMILDQVPGHLSFSMKPGGHPAPQVVEIRNSGAATLNWRLIASSGTAFLSVSAQSGTAPSRILVGVRPEYLPGGGLTAGVSTGQLLFQTADSTVTVPVSISVGEAAPPGARSSQLAGGTNLWPANTENVACGGFGSQDTGYGPYTTAPDGTNTAQLVIEANPANGAVPHYEYRFVDLALGTNTLSFHFKAGADSWAYIVSRVDGLGDANGDVRVWFNLANGTVGTNQFASLINGATAAITPVANAAGWYRASVTFTVRISSPVSGFGLATADQQVGYVAVPGNGVYEWGQQLESGTLTAYQPNVGPCMVIAKAADALTVAAGSPIGFTISVGNNAAPGTGAATAATVNDPLPGGSGVNWSISPAYGGPGTCAITGTAPSQSLACQLGDLTGAALALVHVTSGTSASSCGTYSNTATASAQNNVSVAASAATVVPCVKAVMSTPPPGSTLSGSAVTFTWSAGAGATAYWLDVGTVQGQGNIYAANVGLVNSQMVSGIPTTGATIYVRLWTQINAVWSYNDYTYTAANVKAVMSTPAPGSTLSGSTVMFTWSAGTGASAYWLDVGTVQGQGNIYGANVGLITSQTVSGIPTTGVTIYVRLWTQINGVWSYFDYTYTAANTKAVMSSPAPGSTLSGSIVTFTWSAGLGASAYWLDVGTVQGQGNIYGANVGLVTSKQVSGIPTTGGAIYVRLWTQLNGVWSYFDYTYTAVSAKAVMSTPAPGSTLSGSTVTFTWSTGISASAYWLDVGTVQGQGNIYGANVGLVTSKQVTGIPTAGGTIYVRLWTQISGVWSYNDYTYTAAGGSGKAVMSTPAPGSTLSGSTVTFTWSAGTGASAYWLDVGTVQGQGNIYAANVGLITSQTVSGIPTNGVTIYVRLWTQISGVWSYNDYTYTAL